MQILSHYKNHETNDAIIDVSTGFHHPDIFRNASLFSDDSWIQVLCNKISVPWNLVGKAEWTQDSSKSRLTQYAMIIDQKNRAETELVSYMWYN